MPIKQTARKSTCGAAPRKPTSRKPPPTRKVQPKTQTLTLSQPEAQAQLSESSSYSQALSQTPDLSDSSTMRTKQTARKSTGGVAPRKVTTTTSRKPYMRKVPQKTLITLPSSPYIHPSQTLNMSDSSTTTKRTKQTARKSTGGAVPRKTLIKNGAQRSGGSTSTSEGPVSADDYYDSYGGEENFMHSFGLKPWDSDDVEMAGRIMQEFTEGAKAESKRRKAG